jgi:hypothetical protein
MPALELEAKIPRTTREETALAPVARLGARLAALLPTHKNTKRGRSSARTVKLVLFAVGFVVVVAEPGALTFAIGAALALAGLALPLPELQKRSLVRRLRRGAHRRRTTMVPASLVLDDRRLELHFDGSMDRRVLTNRPFVLEAARLDDRLCAVVAPRSGCKKIEMIWICQPSLEVDDLPGDPGDIRSAERSEADHPAIVDDRGAWLELYDELRRRHDAATAT